MLELCIRLMLCAMYVDNRFAHFFLLVCFLVDFLREGQWN